MKGRRPTSRPRSKPCLPVTTKSDLSLACVGNVLLAAEWIQRGLGTNTNQRSTSRSRSRLVFPARGKYIRLHRWHCFIRRGMIIFTTSRWPFFGSATASCTLRARDYVILQIILAPRTPPRVPVDPALHASCQLMMCSLIDKKSDYKTTPTGSGGCGEKEGELVSSASAMLTPPYAVPKT